MGSGVTATCWTESRVAMRVLGTKQASSMTNIDAAETMSVLIAPNDAFLGQGSGNTSRGRGFRNRSRTKTRLRIVNQGSL